MAFTGIELHSPPPRPRVESVSMSFCSGTQPGSDLIWWKSGASSANNLIVPDRSLLMSFIYVKTP